MRAFRKERNWTQAELASRLSVTAAYISMVESGKQAVTDRLREQLNSLSSNKITPIVIHGSATIPYYRHYIHAGIKGAHVLDDEVEQFNINEHYANTAAYEVAGDSMEDADIRDGDRVIVRLGHRFKQNEIILCRFNGELMVKGARIVNDAIWLLPMNDKYHPWECKETDQLEVIGVVVEVIRKPDITAVKGKSI